MTIINPTKAGSSLDDFLEEEGILNEVTAIAHKRVLAWQIRCAMEEQHLTKVEMAERMNTSRAALDRLLNPNNPSVTLDTMDRAATALGKHLSISLSD
ncbi:MAG: XRE family transcriptional regulator [Alphaproteobacteria bacterium]